MWNMTLSYVGHDTFICQIRGLGGGAARFDLAGPAPIAVRIVAMCCSFLQCVAVCCSVLQRVVVCCSV